MVALQKTLANFLQTNSILNEFWEDETCHWNFNSTALKFKFKIQCCLLSSSSTPLAGLSSICWAHRFSVEAQIEPVKVMLALKDEPMRKKYLWSLNKQGAIAVMLSTRQCFCAFENIWEEVSVYTTYCTPPSVSAVTVSQASTLQWPSISDWGLYFNRASAATNAKVLGACGGLQIHLLFWFMYVRQRKVQKGWVKVNIDQKVWLINMLAASHINGRPLQEIRLLSGWCRATRCEHTAPHICSYNS